VADWQETELRLESRSAERRASLERRDRRRRWLPWLICPLVLPAVGAAAALFALDNAGGDLGNTPAGEAIGLAAACLLLPAAVAAWVGRHQGRVEAVLWGLVCAAIEVALIFGVGFVALDLGPQ
jgi:hypothetical protein